MTGTMGDGTSHPLMRISLHRPVTVLMLLITLAVIGALAYRSIPLQLVPPGITHQTVSVWIPVRDSTPEEVMEEVAEPAEELMRTIQGVTQITTFSRANGCRLRVRYGSAVDGDAIYADVRDRMERLLPDLPEESDRYRIFRFNLETDLPILQLAVTYDETVRDVDTLLENVVKTRLEGVDGVARVEVRGLISERIEIALDPRLVEAQGVDLMRLIERLRGDNIMAPGGVVREGGSRYLLRLASRFENLAEVRHYRINESLELGDIATVDVRRALANFLVRVDGKLCKSVAVSKESEANTIETCGALRHVIENELPGDPRLAGFGFLPYWDQGKVIEDSIDALKQSCAGGGLFAIFVLFLFLRRVRATLVVATAIPLSLLIAVIVIFFRGGTFNVLSITGLTLGIGMLIDNAIVIAENIDRYRARGVPGLRAAESGVREVALAITLATLTTVAVFLPIVFLSGNTSTRVLLGELGLPVCYSVLASLFVALVFIPIGSIALGGTRVRGGDGVEPRESLLQRGYRRVLGFAVRFRLATVMLSILVLLSTQVPAYVIGEQGGNDSRSRSFQVSVECPPHFDLREADETMEAVRQAFLPLVEELHIENMVSWFDAGGGTFAFFLEPAGATTERVFLERIRGHLPQLAGVEIDLARQEEEDEQQELRVSAEGRDPRVLLDLLDRIARRLRSQDEVVEVVSPRESANDEVMVEVVRERAQRFRVNPGNVANLVSWALRGAPLPDFETSEAEVPFWIRYENSDLESLGELYRVPVYSDRGEAIPLANLARFGVGRGLPSIFRREGKVVSSLRVITKPGIDSSKLLVRVQRWFGELDVPDGYRLVAAGADRSGFKELQQALILGLVLIFVLMGVLFESFVLPISIVLCIPFMFVGAYWGLFLSGEAMSEVAYIGFVILLGIVVNNAIVLVDTINRFRFDPEHGGDRTRAILEAGKVRLRPILMTTCTTICGLSPLVFVHHQGEGLDYRPLAIVVMGGLTIATIFTLVAVPLCYTLLDDLRRRVAADVGRLRQAAGDGPESALPARGAGESRGTAARG